MARRGEKLSVGNSLKAKSNSKSNYKNKKRIIFLASEFDSFFVCYNYFLTSIITGIIVGLRPVKLLMKGCNSKIIVFLKST